MKDFTIKLLKLTLRNKRARLKQQLKKTHRTFLNWQKVAKPGVTWEEQIKSAKAGMEIVLREISDLKTSLEILQKAAKLSKFKRNFTKRYKKLVK